MNMPLEPSWLDITLRLALTMLAGAIIGFNRGARGHAAGFRTTILVGLAAAVAMIQANILLPVSGKTSESFAVMDLMRLPLGILTGVGFIGGGTILKKGDLVTGVTTAATLWLMTVIGLCLGGGQLVLGTIATALAVLTLWVLKWVDLVIPREHRAKLTVTCPAQWNVLEDIPKLIRPMKYRARFHEQKRSLDPDQTDYSFELSWRRPELDGPPIELLQTIDRHFPIKSFELTTDNGR
ncbi:MAG: MgtC/SapB family protein [Bradyrhizobium sp.]|nr:MgtC/SapB family protein [Pseudomonadota bacterium]MDE2068714.1 MgtC/SapB family protein [Bradyrhizobium sp.]MDE2242088.1 MgtC/SapB family protein [Bradyrhizobium sp.]MDE2470114.1 MgtC/SapB family protein [Bradyrhizobium sp.]